MSHDAHMNACELSTLTESGITSSSLTATVSNQNNANNLVAEVGRFTCTDNTTSEISAVQFRMNIEDFDAVVFAVATGEKLTA